MTLREIEDRVILATYKECNQDTKATAAKLGVSLKTVYNRIAEIQKANQTPPEYPNIPDGNADGFMFSIGEHVSKYTGDYDFEGVVVSVFKKLSGQHRYDVENEHGSVHIFSASQLRPMKPDEIEAWKIKRVAHNAKKNLHSSP